MLLLMKLSALFVILTLLEGRVYNQQMQVIVVAGPG